MSLFGSDGCTSHHWGNQTEKYAWQLRPHNVIVHKVLYTCQHEGCRETKTEWERLRGLSNEERDELFALLRGDDE